MMGRFLSICLPIFPPTFDLLFALVLPHDEGLPFVVWKTQLLAVTPDPPLWRHQSTPGVAIVRHATRVSNRTEIVVVLYIQD